MKIAATQSGLVPRQVQGRANTRQKGSAQGTARAGKIRHVLHGWRVLLAPIVTQVLERYGPAPARVPVDYALGAYRRWQDAPPAARYLRDI